MCSTATRVVFNLNDEAFFSHTGQGKGTLPPFDTLVCTAVLAVLYGLHPQEIVKNNRFHRLRNVWVIRWVP